MQYEIREKKNYDLYMEVYRARKTAGMKVFDGDGQINHPLVGRYLRNTETGAIMYVKKAARHWLWGWYVGLLIESPITHSGCFILWENESSEEVKDRAERNRKKYTVEP